MLIKKNEKQDWNKIFYKVMDEIEASDLDSLPSGKLGTHFLDKIDFGDFFDMILILLEKANIKKIESIDDLSSALRYLYKNGKTNDRDWELLDDILYGAWASQPGPGGGYASAAESHLMRLRVKFGLTKWVFMIGNIMYLGYSDHIPQQNWCNYHSYRLTYLYPKFKRAINKKYLASIISIARELAVIIESNKLKEIRRS
jgi:hypothetical protein